MNSQNARRKRRAEKNKQAGRNGPTNGKTHGNREGAKPPGHVPQSRPKVQDVGHDFSRQRSETCRVSSLGSTISACCCGATATRSWSISTRSRPSCRPARSRCSRRSRTARTPIEPSLRRPSADQRTIERRARRRRARARWSSVLISSRGSGRTRRAVPRRGARRRSGSRARSISTVVGAETVPLNAIRPATYLGKGKVEAIAAKVESRGDRSCRHGLRAVAGAAAQPREGVRLQGHRPHRAYPGNFRPPSAHRRGRAASRARPSGLSALTPRALMDPSRAAARRLRLSRRTRRNPDRDRPAPDPGAHRPHRAGARRGQAQARPASREPRATFPIRSSRWSATPTPASRRCSIG